MSLSIFLGAYPIEIRERFLLAKTLLESLLLNSEQVLDIPAKMLAFTYGSNSKDIICVLIPSRTELKISFTQGAILESSTNLLKGTGKKTRYVEIKRKSDLDNPALHQLIRKALILHKEQQD